MTTPTYLNLRTTRAQYRLQTLRAQAKPGTTWRDARRWKLNNWHAAYCEFGQGSRDWYSHTGPHFRAERTIDGERKPGSLHRYAAWYTDEDCTATAAGLVARLPHGKFLAGYLWSDNGERVYAPGVYDDEREAMDAADEHARIFADNAREHDYLFRQRQRIEDDIAEDSKALRIAYLARNHRVIRSTPGDFACIRAGIARLAQRIRKQRAELERLQ